MELPLSKISRFHYLTQDMPYLSHPELIEIACAGGIRWVQLRVKNKLPEEWLIIAEQAKEICDRYNAILIINDNVEIAKAVGAHGVHLGKGDMSIDAARELLGMEKIIGATANTLEDILRLDKAGVDYIGLGPFRFTDTKKNLSPVLGVEGYEEVLKQYSGSIPVIAIGGIVLEDIKPLFNSGVHGVAVSSAINLAANKQEVILQFLKGTAE
jgi:thiamine-phosphate pyrophosphorylase